MAQLKDTVITGSLRVTDSILSNSAQFQILRAPTSAGAVTYGAGTDGQVLKTNGTSIYWGSPPATGVTSVQVQASTPLSSSVYTAQTSTLNTTISFETQAHNTVLAGPAGTSAPDDTPSFRSLTADDLPNATTSTKGAVIVGAGLAINTATISISGVDATNGSTTQCLTKKGTWASFSTSDTQVTQAYSEANANYPLLMTVTPGTDSTNTRGATTAILNNAIYANPYDGALYATKVYNAVWNDYAEYRKTLEHVKPGQVVFDNDDGSMSITNKRLISGAQVVSDTWGHIMGKTNEATTPIAVAGRVLVYTYQDRKNYHAGQVVCSAPNGTVDIMTREEIKNYPEAIIGIVSEIPEYLYWGTDNVLVDNRIWIKIR